MIAYNEFLEIDLAVYIIYVECRWQKNNISDGHFPGFLMFLFDKRSKFNIFKFHFAEKFVFCFVSFFLTIQNFRVG